MDKKQIREFNETINHIFKMDEREVFSNEIKSLMEEIEKYKLQNCKVLILINFIQYKLNELDSHHELAKEMLKNQKNSQNLNLLNLFSKYCDDHHFLSVKKFMVDVLVEKLVEIKNFNIDQVKNSFKKINSKSQCQQTHGENIVKEESVVKYIESKLDEKKNSSKDFYDNINLTAEDLLLNNHNTNYDNIGSSNNISNLNEYTYDLKIYYSGGAESCSQNCSIKIASPVDLDSFIFYLKKRLGIYEHAKFNILILNKEKQEVQYLNNISQLSIKEVNEIKIVPDD
jgi:hypothetical protein